MIWDGAAGRRQSLATNHRAFAASPSASTAPASPTPANLAVPCSYVCARPFPGSCQAEFGVRIAKARRPVNARRPANAHRPGRPRPAPRNPGRGRCSPVHQAGQQFRRQASPQVVRLAEGEKVSSAGVTSRPAGARHQLHVTRLDWPHKRMARAAVVSIGPAIDAGAPGPGVPGGWPPKALGRKPYHSSSQEVTLSQAAKRGGDEREVSATVLKSDKPIFRFPSKTREIPRK